MRLAGRQFWKEVFWIADRSPIMANKPAIVEMFAADYWWAFFFFLRTQNWMLSSSLAILLSCFTLRLEDQAPTSCDITRQEVQPLWLYSFSAVIDLQACCSAESCFLAGCLFDFGKDNPAYSNRPEDYPTKPFFGWQHSTPQVWMCWT